MTQMTRERLIEQHQKNIVWINEQIRICLMARRLLKGEKEANYSHLIWSASEHHRPELLPLKEAVNTEFWSLRFTSYGRALISTVFDVKHFIYEARLLKWKAEEHPWLNPTPA